MLRRVTITGADASIYPIDLAQLSKEFPFVEWGILVSSRHTGTGSARFPGRLWINAVQTGVYHGLPLHLSLHVCGAWIRELLMGNNLVPYELMQGMERVQLNFHAERLQHGHHPQAFAAALSKFGTRQLIFQMDGHLGPTYLGDAQHWAPTLDCVPLFDTSHGAGMLPVDWPSPIAPYCGYAGGLGPENLAAQLPQILSRANAHAIWIDMESRVRSEDDQWFDLEKVRRCLEIAAPYISPEG